MKSLCESVFQQLEFLSSDEDTVRRIVLMPIVEDCVVAFLRGEAFPTPEALGLSQEEAERVYSAVRTLKK